MTELPVVTQGLAKHYGSTCALAPCSLQVEAGEILGLLGPNGAGKTTLLRLLMGYLRPSAGWARIAGRDAFHDRVAIHRGLGYLPGEARLFRRMRGRDVLRFFSRVHPRGDENRARHVADRLEVDTSRQIARCSTGMRQKIALAAVLSLDVPLLILDEPTTNLDPTARDVVLDLVREAQTQGRSVLFSSHVLSEVELLCNRAALLRGGQLVHVVTLADLRKSHRVRASLAGESLDSTAMPAGVSLLSQEDGQVTLEISGHLSEALRWLGQLPLEEVQIEPLGLRTVYNRHVLERET